MTLVVNLVRTVSSAKFICYCCCNGAIVTSRTHQNVTNQQKYGQIINCGLTIVIDSLLSLCRLRIMTQLRSGAVDKMAGIFTQRIMQPCGIFTQRIMQPCQPNELKWEIKKKLGWPNGGPSKNLGSMAHP